MNTPHAASPASTLPLLRHARTLIAMGTVGLALVVAAPSDKGSKQAMTKTTPQPNISKDLHEDLMAGIPRKAGSPQMEYIVLPPPPPPPA
jgi:hypothetical protein